MELLDRFMSRVIMIPECACWLWSLYHDKDGYGTFHVKGKTCRAHVASYEIFVGPIPGGKQLDHTCRNRGCVNWRHLEPVTNIENQARSPITMMGKVECRYGHGPENFVAKHDGRRLCVVCQRQNWRIQHEREKMRTGRGDALQTRTHCNHGHEFTPENTYLKPGTGGVKKYRACWACRRLREGKRKAARP